MNGKTHKDGYLVGLNMRNEPRKKTFTAQRRPLTMLIRSRSTKRHPMNSKSMPSQSEFRL